MICGESSVVDQELAAFGDLPDLPDAEDATAGENVPDGVKPAAIIHQGNTMLQSLPIALALLSSSPLAASVAPAGTDGPPASAAPPAPDGSEAVAVSASNGFGIDLFKMLTSANADGNLFLSPYSISIALTMAAEGARDQTEREMAAVLHFPIDPASDGRAITSVHNGFAALARQLAAAQGNTDPGTEARIATLRATLDAANARSRELSAKGDRWQEAMKAHEEATQAANELNALLSTVDRFDLRIANALWVERTYPLSPAYSATIDQHYGSGAAHALDIVGDTERARQRINGWVEDHTEKRIKDLIPSRALTPDTRLVITNAVYFKGQWTVPFSESNTRQEKFTKSDGSAIDVRMMNDSWRGDGSYAAFTGKGEFFDTPVQVPVEEAERPPTYPDDAGFQVLQLPYKGGDLAMVLLLPRTAAGLPALERQLSADAFDGWMRKLSPRAVDTSIPRFKLEYESEMSGALKALGMKRAFVTPELPGGAQFPGMTTSTELLKQLFIGAVLHKAWVEVAEKGTEAAAATAVMMPPAGAAPQRVTMVPFIPQFRADRPFLFLIRDTKSGAIIFMGRVANPE